MIDDQEVGFFPSFLGVFTFALIIAYHYVTADPKYEANRKPRSYSNIHMQG